ncbi:MAG TPA: hypothetical protein GX516_06875 [Thermoanaerobacter sp.]|nr:hypothetical protein [Thermoanaerobacter sp.]
MSDAVKYASSRPSRQWEKIRDAQTDDQKWYFFNSVFRLAQAIEKNNKSEIETWEYLVEQTIKKRPEYMIF